MNGTAVERCDNAVLCGFSLAEVKLCMRVHTVETVRGAFWPRYHSQQLLLLYFAQDY